MCDPVTIAVTAAGISAATAGLQYVEQKKQAGQQQKAVEYGLALEQAALGRQYDEQNAVAQEQMGERARQHLQDLGRLNSLAAETGAAGSSTERIITDEANGFGRDITTLQQNARRAGEQSHAQGLSGQAEANTMMANIRRPSALGTGLQIAAAGAQAYGATRVPTAPKPTTKG